MVMMYSRVASLLLFLLAAGRGSDAICSGSELQSIADCFSPYNVRFFTALGRRPSDTTCQTEKITTEVCGWFSNIVTCVKGKDLNPQTCLPNAASQTNTLLQIPCTVQDLFNACPRTPCIWELGNCDGNGSAGKGSASFLWMTSLMTTFLAVGLAAHSG
eukprot:TRINITY_DN67372_c0_g1_i2.p1 TRINITY_DN67372_c0_g1~~TRINITY_DN67372_c0_g1_i2.p1  ORF type:complete len:159 (-),score=20.71 TRINITY_DN67372_c0_g1_i2:199-675(-)